MLRPLTSDQRPITARVPPVIASRSVGSTMNLQHQVISHCGGTFGPPLKLKPRVYDRSSAEIGETPSSTKAISAGVVATPLRDPASISIAYARPRLHGSSFSRRWRYPCLACATLANLCFFGSVRGASDIPATEPAEGRSSTPEEIDRALLGDVFLVPTSRADTKPTIERRSTTAIVPVKVYPDPAASNLGQSGKPTGLTTADPYQQAVNAPFARAAEYRAVSTAESMIDGLGGVPSFIGSGIQSSRAPIFRRPFRLGPVSLRPEISVSAGATYGSYSQNLTQAGQTVGEAEPANGSSNEDQVGGGATQSTNVALILTIGDPATGHFLSLNYAANCHFSTGGDTASGTGNTDTLALTQSLALAGRMDFAKLKLGLGISFASLSGSNRDFGRGVNRQLLGVALTSSYPLSPKTDLNWDIGLPIYQVSGGIDSTGFTSTNSITHQFSPKLNAGIGFSYGIDNQLLSDLDSSNLLDDSESEEISQTYKQLFIRFSFVPSVRLSFSGSVGADFRGEESTSINPTFNLGVSWMLREGTSVSLSGSETIRSSSSRLGENFLSTSFVLGVSQRLGRRMNLGVSLGYENASYSFIESGSDSDRRDDLYSAQIGLNFNLSERWASSLSYVYAKNVSTTDSFSSSTGQFQMTYTF